LENRGRKRFIKLGVSISTNRPSLDGLDLDDCSSMPSLYTLDDWEAMRQQLEQMKAQQVRRVSSV
jgi:hypothetical protein